MVTLQVEGILKLRGLGEKNQSHHPHPTPTPPPMVLILA
jgi:hypothetical protein